MTRRAALLATLLAGCGRATTVTRPAMPPAETQLTTAPHGHILTNTAVWSPDSQWIVYDVRSDVAGSVFNGTRIERVNVKTKQVEVLYESKNGACVGVATVNPVDGRVVFIHGPENPTPDWSYSACHREGVIVDPAKPGVAVALEARDVVPPFTFGALRGGTHVHTWDSTGQFVSFTYEDHVLTHGTAERKEPNRRTVGLAHSILHETIPNTHPRNRQGTLMSSVVAATVAKPRLGTDEVVRAFEDGWVPGSDKVTFIGEVVANDGRHVNELFFVDLKSGWRIPPYAAGTATTMPPVPLGVTQTRLTRFADIAAHTGLSTTPRHWPRTSPDGKRIAFLTENGLLHLLPFSSIEVPATHAPHPRPLSPEGRGEIRVQSAFTWHPNAKYLAAVVDKSVCLIDVNTGKVTPLTTPSDPPPRPEACVVSPDGSKVAFVRTVGGFNQVFVVDVPPEVVK